LKERECAVASKTDLTGPSDGAYLLCMAAIQLELPAELETFLKGKVRRDGFASEAEAIQAMVVDWKLQEALTADDLRELREEVEIGLRDLESGRTLSYSARDVIEACRPPAVAAKRQ
jgi:Arc/MetJ-type ribon-helix-helix transcriptional regulator